jgi:hypothetical protein
LLDLAKRGFDLRARRVVGFAVQSQGVVSKSLWIGFQLLVATRDVENDVLVLNQAVRGQKVLEATAVIAALIGLGAE